MPISIKAAHAVIINSRRYIAVIVTDLVFFCQNAKSSFGICR